MKTEALVPMVVVAKAVPGASVVKTGEEGFNSCQETKLNRRVEPEK